MHSIHRRSQNAEDFVKSSLRVVGEALPEPPYPAEIRARGFPFEVDWERIEQSDTWTLCPAHVRPWLLMMWARSWQSSPCGTWPDNDLLIAARIGMEDRQFKAHRDILMRGWYRSSDDRLYHPVIVEFVLKMCKLRVKDANRMAEWRNKKKQALSSDVAGGSHVSHGESRVSHGTAPHAPPPPPHPVGSSDSSNPPRQPTLSPDLEMDEDDPKIPRCPHKQIIALYHEKLPELPRCLLDTKNRPPKTLAFWKWVLTSTKSNGERRASNPEEALKWIGDFFERARKNSFVMGQTKPNDEHDGWRASYDYLISEKGRVQVIERTREQRR